MQHASVLQQENDSTLIELELGKTAPLPFPRCALKLVSGRARLNEFELEENVVYIIDVPLWQVKPSIRSTSPRYQRPSRELRPKCNAAVVQVERLPQHRRATFGPSALRQWISRQPSVQVPSTWVRAVESILRQDLHSRAAPGPSSTEMRADVVVVVGPQSVGKSNFVCQLVNAAVSSGSAPRVGATHSRTVGVLDCDVGQCLLGPPGIVSAALCSSEGIEASLPQASKSVDSMMDRSGVIILPWVVEPPACCDGSRALSGAVSVAGAYGAHSPEMDPRGYTACCVATGHRMIRILHDESTLRSGEGCIQMDDNDDPIVAATNAAGGAVKSRPTRSVRPLLVVNTCGWVKGAGMMALQGICTGLRATSVVCVGNHVGTNATGSGEVGLAKHPLRVWPFGLSHPSGSDLLPGGSSGLGAALARRRHLQQVCPWRHIDVESVQVAKRHAAAALALALQNTCSQAARDSDTENILKKGGAGARFDADASGTSYNASDVPPASDPAVPETKQPNDASEPATNSSATPTPAAFARPSGTMARMIRALQYILHRDSSWRGGSDECIAHGGASMSDGNTLAVELQRFRHTPGALLHPRRGPCSPSRVLRSLREARIPARGLQILVPNERYWGGFIGAPWKACVGRIVALLGEHDRAMQRDGDAAFASSESSGALDFRDEQYASVAASRQGGTWDAGTASALASFERGPPAIARAAALSPRSPAWCRPCLAVAVLERIEVGTKEEGRSGQKVGVRRTTPSIGSVETIPQQVWVHVRVPASVSMQQLRCCRVLTVLDQEVPVSMEEIWDGTRLPGLAGGGVPIPVERGGGAGQGLGGGHARGVMGGKKWQSRGESAAGQSLATRRGSQAAATGIGGSDGRKRART